MRSLIIWRWRAGEISWRTLAKSRRRHRLTRVRAIWRERWHDRRRHSHCYGKVVKNMEKGSHSKYLRKPLGGTIPGGGIIPGGGGKGGPPGTIEGKPGPGGKGGRAAGSSNGLPCESLELINRTYGHRTREEEGAHRTPWEAHL